jgi:PhnB protein
MVEPIPAGYHSVTPYLMVRDAAKALAFYRDAFGAFEVMRFEGQGGKVAHAEIRIGDSHVMLADEQPEQGFVGPQTLGGAGISLMLYVVDVDRTFAQALAAGATERIASARSSIRSGTYGRSPRIARTCRSTKCAGACRRCSATTERRRWRCIRSMASRDPGRRRWRRRSSSRASRFASSRPRRGRKTTPTPTSSR